MYRCRCRHRYICCKGLNLIDEKVNETQLKGKYKQEK